MKNAWKLTYRLMMAWRMMENDKQLRDGSRHGVPCHTASWRLYNRGPTRKDVPEYFDR